MGCPASDKRERLVFSAIDNFTGTATHGPPLLT